MFAGYTEIIKQDGFVMNFYTKFNQQHTPNRIEVDYEGYTIICSFENNLIYVLDAVGDVLTNYINGEDLEAHIQDIVYEVEFKQYEIIFSRLRKLLIKALKQKEIISFKCANKLSFNHRQGLLTKRVIIENSGNTAYIDMQNKCLYYNDEFETWCKINFKTTQQLLKFVGEIE